MPFFLNLKALFNLKNCIDKQHLNLYFLHKSKKGEELTYPVSREQDLSRMMILSSVRCMAGFPIEHSLELFKTTAQANPLLPIAKTILQITKEKGIFGFTNTLLTNLPRRVLREVVRWPIIGYARTTLSQDFPHYFPKNGLAVDFLACSSGVFFDCAFILPLEQLIAYRVKENERYASFFKNRQIHEIIRNLYCGVGMNLVRQYVFCATYLMLNNETKKEFDVWDKERAHPFLRQGVTSMIIAAGIVAWGLPFDFVKSRVMMDGNLQKMKTTLAIRCLYRQFGFLGFYAGALPTFLHSTFHATTLMYTMECFSSNR